MLVMRYDIALWLVLATAAATAAQQSAEPRDFEVASVKRSEISAGGPVGSAAGVVSPGGRWSATNVTVSQLIQNLYDLRPEQIVGAPSWANSDMFVAASCSAIHFSHFTRTSISTKYSRNTG